MEDKKILSTDIEQKAIIERIERIITILMEEQPLFKKEFNSSEIAQHLFNLVRENMTTYIFQDTPDEKLKEIFSFVMSTKLMSGMLEDLTPEQIFIFDEAVKRK